ncbi:MAG: riboflavin synthase [Phycisphaerales bacterium]|nr:MAG: riboflavin synthase [Phycisphaerales bacterium]
MFTGLIEGVGEVRSVAPSGSLGGGALVVDLGELADDCRLGDSIAINGACLTVMRLDGTLASFGLSAETLATSTLAQLRPRVKVNVERAMKATDRFGGHIVQGHVDGIGAIRAINRQGEFADIEFGVDGALLDQMVAKGSVAIDGVSLTIAKLDPEGFRVAAIPETLARTTLGGARIGQQVNIEIDIIVKVVRRQLERIMPGGPGLTVERLKQMGF